MPRALDSVLLVGWALKGNATDIEIGNVKASIQSSFGGVAGVTIASGAQPATAMYYVRLDALHVAAAPHQVHDLAESVPKGKGDTLVVCSPEKAGGGGSTPSLATTFQSS